MSPSDGIVPDAFYPHTVSPQTRFAPHHVLATVTVELYWVAAMPNPPDNVSPHTPLALDGADRAMPLRRFQPGCPGRRVLIAVAKARAPRALISLRPGHKVISAPRSSLTFDTVN